MAYLLRSFKYIIASCCKHKTCIIGIGSVLAQIGTVIAAIVAVFALKEAVLQRESMYRPELRMGEIFNCANVNNLKNIKYYEGTIYLLAVASIFE